MEVLVSIVVLSVGLLGTLGMLLASVRADGESATFTAALNLARELSEKARMNKGIAVRNDAGNAYLVEDWRAPADLVAAPAGTPCVTSGAGCGAAQLAAWDMGEWERRIAKALPDARLSVCFDEAPWNAAAGDYAWACSHSGRTVVVKLGWTPHGGPGAKTSSPSSSAPRLVMQLVAGQAHDGQAGS